MRRFLASVLKGSFQSIATWVFFLRLDLAIILVSHDSVLTVEFAGIWEYHNNA